jgi:hypothetical protein
MTHSWLQPSQNLLFSGLPSNTGPVRPTPEYQPFSGPTYTLTVLCVWLTASWPCIECYQLCSGLWGHYIATHCHSSPFPIGEVWTSHWNSSTCSDQWKPWLQVPPYISSITGCQTASSLFPIASGIYHPPALQAYTVPFFPITSHFTLKSEAAWISEMLVSYHNVT